MKPADLRAMSVDQLDDEFLKLKKERFNLRFQRATGQLENTSRVRAVRRDIARIKTIAAQKRSGTGAGGCRGDDRNKSSSEARCASEGEVEVEVRRCRSARSKAPSSATSRTRPSSCASSAATPIR